MKNDLISIITPCYNGASYIAGCIESVCMQSYENWEMLIVDDCSTDNSAEIIQKYIEKDPRIKYYRTMSPSGGPALPRNIGIDQARGEYIAFLDCDDIWFPNKLEEQYQFIVAHKHEFVYSDYEKMSYDGIRCERFIKTKLVSTYRDTLKSCAIPCLTVLMSRRIIGPSRFISMPKEDYVMWLEILKKGVAAYNTGKVHALYRESDSSRSSNKIDMAKGQWFVLRSVEKVDFARSIYYMICYIVKGFMKYIK